MAGRNKGGVVTKVGGTKIYGEGRRVGGHPDLQRGGNVPNVPMIGFDGAPNGEVSAQMLRNIEERNRRQRITNAARGPAGVTHHPGERHASDRKKR